MLSARRVTFSAVLLGFVFFGVVSCAQSLIGRLDPELVKPPGPHWRVHHLPWASHEERSNLSIDFDDGALVWMDDLEWNGSGGKRTVVLVARRNGTYDLGIDQDADGRLGVAEWIRLRTDSASPGDFDGSVNFPSPVEPFGKVEVLFRVLDSNSVEGRPQLLHYNDQFLVRGWFELDGQRILAVFEYKPELGRIDPRNSRIGIDSSGDGKIDFGPRSTEYVLARDEDAVFRVGNSYVSIADVDIGKLQFSLRVHPAGDYTRIEFHPGESIPDFDFLDFGGAKGAFSGYRGKYLLIDFWASWCGPCMAELPSLVKLYSRFRPRGFEILGINGDETPKPAESVVAKFGIRWRNARADSVKDLVERRFRISVWPTRVLVDPSGKIIAADRYGKPDLDPAALETMLNGLLGPP